MKESITQLHAYMGGIIKNNGGQCITISGTGNHTHLLINLPPSISIATLLCKLKSCSSKWYQQCIQQDPQNKDPSFAWSCGYLTFSVSPESINSTKNYLSNETERHTKIPTENEILHILNIQDISPKIQYLIETTYTRLVYHLIWSVKNRMSFLDNSIQEELHEIIRTEVEKNQGKVCALGNVADHIHLLVECPRTLATADLVQKLKTLTTYFLRKQSRRYHNFTWQEGYGVFSVGRPAFDACKAYVLNQEKHHAVRTFEEEWRAFSRLR